MRPMENIRFISLFAGIGGFDLAFERSGMECVAQVEIDKNARALLDRCFPTVQRFDDVRQVGAHNLPSDVDIVCGGFPCQDLSVAGKRAGLAGERSGLFYEMARITNELGPSFLVWENVPGLLSSNRGLDFLAVLTELERIGYCGAWTGLDARWFGLAQRRRRIFGVFARRDIGAGCCAEILSLTNRLCGDSAPSRNKGAELATDVAASLRSRGKNSGTRIDNAAEDIAPTLRSQNFDKSHINGGGQVAIALVDSVDCIKGAAIGRKPEAGPQYGEVIENQSYTLNTTEVHAVRALHHVRRLTPTECERLQGFPDGWTDGQSDSVRYRQLGNAVAVPVVEWISRKLVAFLRKGDSC